MRLINWTRSARIIGAALTAAAALFVSGCLNKDKVDATSESADVVIGLTDAKGDFLHYAVKVSNLTLTKKDGSIVQTILEPVEIDFAQLTELTEFLTAATVPNGYYTKATMELDYSAANIEVEDANGAATKVTSIKDSDGAAITTLTVDMQLQGATGVLIAPGTPSHLTLDFNLNASNHVVYDNADTIPVSITVDPILSGELNAEAPKTHRLRGGLLAVDQTANTFKLGVRPFAHKIAKSGRTFGNVTVTSTSDTTYEINGETTKGAPGLAALAAQPDFTAVTAVGNLKFSPTRFEATEVYAGSSVPGGTLDVVAGVVTARTGTSVSVKGTTLVRNDGKMIFRDTANVTLANTTKVTRAGVKSDVVYTIADISVGQRVTIMGTLADPAATTLALTADRVRLDVSDLRGTVVTNTDGQPLVVDVQILNGRAPTAYNFAGTGPTGNDANASGYRIDIGSALRTDLTTADEVQVRGFVHAFGMAPPDFDAASLVNLGEARARLEIGFGVQGLANAVTFSTNSLEVTGFGDGLVHHVTKRRVVTDLSTLTDKTPTFAPAAGSDGKFKGVYAIKAGRSVVVYRTYSEFATDLQARITAGGKMKQLVAAGTFVNASSTLSGNEISVVMK